MENALSTLSVLPSSKLELASFKASAKEAILNGYNEPLEILRTFKVFDEISKLRADKEIKAYIEIESDKYTEKTIEAFGCEFQKREMPKYDYSACEDSELDMMENELKLLTENIKARKKFLITLKDNYINQETGEIVKPPVVTYTNSIAVKLK